MIGIIPGGQHNAPQRPTLRERAVGAFNRNKGSLLTAVGTTLALGTVATLYRASGDAAQLRGAKESDSTSSATAGGRKLLSVDTDSASRRMLSRSSDPETLMLLDGTDSAS